MEIEKKVWEALKEYGANPVAKALGLSREGAMSLALGISTNGTRALGAQNIERLETLRK